MKLSDNARAQIEKISNNRLKEDFKAEVEGKNSQYISAAVTKAIEKAVEDIISNEQEPKQKNNINRLRDNMFKSLLIAVKSDILNLAPSEIEQKYLKEKESSVEQNPQDKLETEIIKLQTDIEIQTRQLLNSKKAQKQENIEVLEDEKKLNNSKLELLDKKEKYSKLYEPEKYKDNSKFFAKDREILEIKNKIIDKKTDILQSEQQNIDPKLLVEKQIALNVAKQELLDIRKEFRKEVKGMLSKQEKQNFKKEETALRTESDSLNERKTNLERKEVGTEIPTISQQQTEPSKPAEQTATKGSPKTEKSAPEEKHKKSILEKVTSKLDKLFNSSKDKSKTNTTNKEQDAQEQTTKNTKERIDPWLAPLKAIRSLGSTIDNFIIGDKKRVFNDIGKFIHDKSEQAIDKLNTKSTNTVTEQQASSDKSYVDKLDGEARKPTPNTPGGPMGGRY